MQVDTYLGITQTYTSEYRASGSKFYGFVFPVDSAEDYERKIKAYKTEYSDATHVCSACVIGLDREYQRFSDDGEPSNSSGRPMLYALLSKEISFVGCAVVRYYGGKKLGIPGLIEAYGGAAELCIEDAAFIELTLMETTVCTIDAAISYELYNYLARRKDVAQAVDTNGKFILRCAKSLTPRLREELKKIRTLVIENEQ
ncbi:MAG: hypothetical protein COA58_03045 [Bacteroidetes bacterium]|nr:MAG: hypothetical protein COA58_03045 [Bacteroidota bacterium]